MSIHYELRQHGPDVTVVVLSGQLNLGNRLADLEHQVKQRIQDGARKIILDLSGLNYIDSAGLGMVAACSGISFKAGGKLAVVCPAGKITQMFELTRLDRVIDIRPDFESALASFTTPSPTAPHE